MQIVKEIRQIDSDKITIEIPKEFMKQTVEIVVSSIEQQVQDLNIKEKLDALDELNGLISDLDQENLNEFDQIISERIPFRKTPIQL